ncbi:MAG: M48 family metallopeptidase [Acidobacteriota bacterium]
MQAQPSILTCPNGHRNPPIEGGVFCPTCGGQLVAVAPPDATARPQPPFNTPPQFYNRTPNFPPPMNYQPPQWYAPNMAGQNFAQGFCQFCGGNGARLAPHLMVCPDCHWLRPLVPGYALDCSVFQWAQDGAAMAKLRSLSPLNAAARTVSDKVGRRWIETTFNAIQLSDKQLPAVYQQAVLAARILALPFMPEVYVSGDRMWDAATYGSDTSAFVIIGTALVTNFQGKDLLFMLAREMGHCRAGHALWKTVIRFLLGEQSPRRGMMAGGLLANLNLSHLVEGAVELPLLAWARQSEITADRAGLLAVMDEEIARRVLLTWYLKSAQLIRQINMEAWLEQEADSDDQMTKLSEMTSSSTPYITRRLKLLTQFARSPEMENWRARMRGIIAPPPVPRAQRPPLIAQGNQPAPASPAVAPPQTKPADDALRIICSACRTPMRIPRSALAGKAALNVRCPNAQCAKIVTLKKQPAPPQPVATPNKEAESEVDS